MPETGALQERIALQAPSTVLDTTGEPGETWTTVWECWARVQVKAIREAFVAAELQAQQTVVFTIREPGFDVLPTHRVLWEGREFDIIGQPALDPTRAFVEIAAVQHRVGTEVE